MAEKSGYQANYGGGWLYFLLLKQLHTEDWFWVFFKRSLIKKHLVFHYFFHSTSGRKESAYNF